MTKGIDISYCQRVVNYDKLPGQIDFAIIRAGYGRVASQKDSMFEKHYSELKKRGIPMGVYWYSYASNVSQAIEEANVCLQIIKGKEFEYPIYIDVEENSQYNLGKTAVSAIVKAFCDTLEKAGYFAGYYTSASWIKNVISDEVRNRYTGWIAHWDVSAPMYTMPLWQYGLRQVDGIGQCDVDYAYTDFPTLIKSNGYNGFTGSGVTVPEKPIETKLKTVKVTIEIDGVKYSGDLNGC